MCQPRAAWFSLWLTNTENNSNEMESVFCSIIVKLAQEREISFVFPYDMGKVASELQNLNVRASKTKGWLVVEAPSWDLPLISGISAAASFTTFYAIVDGVKCQSDKLADMFNKLGSYYFMVVFTHYDESIEILSRYIDNKTIEQVVIAVGTEKDVRTVIESGV